MNELTRTTPNTTTTTTTTTPPTPTIVISLKQQKIEELEGKIKTIAQQIGQERERSSLSLTSSASEIDTMLFQSMLEDEGSALEIEEKTQEMEETQEEVERLKVEKHLLQNGEEVKEQTEKERVGLSKLQQALKQIIQREGTTLVSTAVTSVTALTTPLGVVGGVLLGAVALNEVRKILQRHLSDMGASDHLATIENALQNIESKNRLASEAASEALKQQKMTQELLNETDGYIQELEVYLQDADQEIQTQAKKAKELLLQAKKILFLQRTDLTAAEQQFHKSLDIINQQKMLLEALLKMDIQKFSTMKELLEAVEAKITEALALSSQSCDLHLAGEQHLINAFAASRELATLQNSSYQAMGQIAGLTQANQMIHRVQEQLTKAEDHLKNAEKELEKQKERMSNQAR